MDIRCRDVTFSLFQTISHRGLALINFMDVVINDAKNLEEAIKIPEGHFLDDRARMVNDDVWLELSLKLVKTMRASQNGDVTHEAVLNDLKTQTSKQEDIRTGSQHSADLMTKRIAAVRSIKDCMLVSRNPPKRLQALNYALQACA